MYRYSVLLFKHTERPNLTLKIMQILLAIYNFYKWFNLLKYTVPKSKCRAFYNPIWFKTPPCTKSYFILFQCTYNDSIILVHILYSLYISYVPCKYHIFLVHILYSLYISYIPCTYPIFLVHILYSLYISYIPCTYPIFLVHILYSLYISYIPCTYPPSFLSSCPRPIWMLRLWFGMFGKHWQRFWSSHSSSLSRSCSSPVPVSRSFSLCRFSFRRRRIR